MKFSVAETGAVRVKERRCVVPLSLSFTELVSL